MRTKEAMTPERLDEIEKRANDVLALAAEVRRLTALTDCLRDGLGAIVIRAQVFEENPRRADELLETIRTAVADLQRVEAGPIS